MPITDQTLTLLEQRRKALGITLAEQELALVKAWVEAWDEISPEFEAAVNDLLPAVRDGRLTGAQVSNSIRMRKALEIATGKLDDLADFTEVTAAHDLQRTVLAAAGEQIALAASQLPAGSPYTAPTWTAVSPAALEAIVARTTETIHQTLWPLSDDAVKVMKANLSRGIAVGANPRTVARRIVRQAERGFNGGLTRAMVITRTEMLDAHRAASKAADDANSKVLAGWVWSANMDARTCPSCLAQHGQLHPLNEEGPIDHQCGRCARLPKTKSWKELGFDIPEGPDLLPDSEAWFNSLTPDTQKSIMGPTRLELLQSGKVGWSDLSTRVTTDGWRDSMHVTSIRDLTTKAAP